MASKNKSGKGKHQNKNSRGPGDNVKNQSQTETMKNQDAPAVKEMAFPPETELALPVDNDKNSVPMRHEPVLPAVENRDEAEKVEEKKIDPLAKEVESKETVAAASGEKLAEAGQKDEQPRRKPGPRLPGGIEKRPMYAGNPYLPELATVAEVIEETHNIRTLRLVLDNAEKMAAFNFEPGQVGQISVFGAGEATFVINSPPSQKEYLQFSIMKAGEVTDAIHRLSKGDKVGLRAPLGNYFPYEKWKGKNVFFIGGGIGMAPIRVIMLSLLEHKEDYGKISLLYGARSPKDMAYSYELEDWKNNPDLDCTLCIDNPYENWEHKVGLIPRVLEEINPSAENTVAVLCGPPIMIKFTLQTLQKLGFEPANIVTTLEKRMKCGIGICGRCNIGDRFVCVDGPVFSMEELKELPPDL